MTEAHAPGKLILCGEYAVLCGAPAIAVAVDVRARVRVSHGAGGCRMSIAGGGQWPFVWGEGGQPRWREPGPGQQGRVLEAVAATLAARGLALPAHADLVLDTRDFTVAAAHGDRVKLGLGSSAALTVALTAALLAHAAGSRPAPAEIFAAALAAHRHFQDGGGSGVDVAVAVHGGVTMLTPAAPAPEVRSVAWPAGLAWLAAWSGRSASTTALLARFNAFRESDPTRFGRQMTLLADLARATAVAWAAGEVPRILRCLADYDDALRAFDDGARIGIYTPEHERLARSAESAGAVYKISGAGGGDFGIAFADSPGVIERLAAACAQQGVMTLSCSADVPGVVAACAAPTAC